MTKAEFKKAKKLCEKASPGPWRWCRDYEMTGPNDKRWALENPKRNKDKKYGTKIVINHLLVLAHGYPTLMNGKPVESDPDFQFIANARDLLPKALAHIEKLEKKIELLKSKA